MTHNIDNARQNKGFLTVEETINLYGNNNTVLDPNSVLIGANVAVGNNNIFYPNVILECQSEGSISVGDDNIFYSGTYILSLGGLIEIGSNNEFGTGGCVIKTFKPDTSIAIGDGGRYCNGANISGDTTLGSGSQIIGTIVAQDCSLDGGGTYQEPDPDKRAGVLKGFGLTRNISVGVGRVANGAGNFADVPIEWQRQYHPKASE